MTVRKDIKVLLAESNVKLKDLADEMSEKIGKKITADNISQKLRKGTLRYDDAMIIGDILGYDLKFIKRN
ncbi:TPA: hypothetical protein IAA87_08365 [Candidatus Avigastranaerophilus faecigallinarum]|nr:hypothetical protein [Candidatus Avigastranaerophilus faecigallinarum]